MERLVRRTAGLLAGLLAAVLTGCIDVEYVGQDFPPLPEGTSILFFDAKNPVPAGQFQSIGRATLTVPSGYDNIEVREKIAATARAHGASAVRIVSEERRQVNRYYETSDEEISSSLSGARSGGDLGRLPDGTPTEVNSFGEVVAPNRTYRTQYERVIRILLLMKEQAYQRAVTERHLAAQEK